MNYFDHYLANPIVSIIFNYIPIEDIIKQNDMRAFKERKNHNNIVQYLIKYERMEMMNYLYKINPKIFTENDAILAIESGNTDIVKWFYFIAKIYPKEAFQTACCYDNIEIADFIQPYALSDKYTICHITSQAIINAAKNNRIKMLKFLKSINANYTCDALSWAIMNGNLKAVKFICENYPIIYSTDSVEQAVIKGYLKILKYLHKKTKLNYYRFFVEENIDYDYKTIKFLNKYDYVFDRRDMLDNALRYGNLKMIKLLKDYTCRFEYEFEFNFTIERCKFSDKKYNKKLIKGFKYIIPYTKFAPIIINKIVEYGTLKDIKQIFSTYKGEYSKDIMKAAYENKNKEIIDFIGTNIINSMKKEKTKKLEEYLRKQTMDWIEKNYPPIIPYNINNDSFNFLNLYVNSILKPEVEYPFA
jgi:hypothetical protein